MFFKKLFHVAVKVAIWVLPPIAIALASFFTGFLALPMALAIGFGASYALDRMHTFSIKAENILEKQQRSFIKHALAESLSASETKNNSPKPDTPKLSRPRPIGNLKRSHSTDEINTSSWPNSFIDNKFYRETPPKRGGITSESSESTPDHRIKIRTP